MHAHARIVFTLGFFSGKHSVLRGYEFHFALLPKEEEQEEEVKVGMSFVRSSLNTRGVCRFGATSAFFTIFFGEVVVRVIARVIVGYVWWGLYDVLDHAPHGSNVRHPYNVDL